MDDMVGDRSIPRVTPPFITAQDAGLVGCRTCGLVSRRGTTHCGRCGAPVGLSHDLQLQRIWAWWIAGLICYMPANIYPMLLTKTLTTGSEANTILGGIFELFRIHEYGVAIIVFTASVFIPISKFLAIAALAIGVSRGSRLPNHQRHVLLHIVEFIGRWSMVDVFVVAILSSLVQLGYVAQINPGIAAVFFALSVAATMVAAQSFDPRLIWQQDETHR